MGVDLIIIMRIYTFYSFSHFILIAIHCLIVQGHFLPLRLDFWGIFVHVGGIFATSPRYTLTLVWRLCCILFIPQRCRPSAGWPGHAGTALWILGCALQIPPPLWRLGWSSWRTPPKCCDPTSEDPHRAMCSWGKPVNENHEYLYGLPLKFRYGFSV